MKKSLRILHLEDNPLDGELIYESLEESGVMCELLRVETRDDFISALERGGFDLILADYTLPAFDGITGLSIARRMRPEVPFIFVSGSLGEEVAIETMRCGATDYVLKNRLSRLVPSVRRALDEIKQQEEQRRAERQILFQASLLDQVRNGIIATDADGKIIYWNKFAETLFQWKAEEVRGKNMREIIGSGKDNDMAEQISIQLDKTGYWEGELEVRRRDGDIFPVYVVNSVINNGISEGIVGISIDITERKRAEDALRESETRFRMLADTVPVLIWLCGPDNHRTYFNKVWLEFTGRTMKEETGRGWVEGIHPADRQDYLDIINSNFEAREPYQSEYRLRRFDGEYRLVLATGVPRFTPGGEFAGYVGSCIDITERKQLEEQLRQAQKMEAIGRLAGGVAHDFNNLLTAIIGYSQILIERFIKNGWESKEIEEIEKSGRRAATLTSQLLAFSRRQALQPKMLSLNTVVADMENILRRVIGEDIDLLTILKPELHYVKADPGQMEQIIMNLAVNARDAMAEGGKLVIETGNVDLDASYGRDHLDVTSGPYAMMAVTDTGCGMDNDVRARIFDPFFTTKEVGKGTGLGLSTVYGIVKQSGGHIWVYSEPGQGSTFKIYLPRFADVFDVETRFANTETLPRGTETILLVEDDLSVQGVAARVLNEQGYTVLLASNGEEALQIAEEHADSEIHLLLSDVVMPQMSGKTLASHLKRLRPGICVIFTSGYTDDAIIFNGVLDADLAFLQKPFTPRSLSRKVREVLDSPRQGSASPDVKNPQDESSY